MPRKYQRRPGARPYLSTYTEEDLKLAIKQVQTGQSSLRKTAQEFNIPFATLHRNYKGLPQCRRKPGGQPRLSEQTEKELIVLVSILIDFGILIDSFDIRCMVKGYLDKRGIVDAKFRGNLPGIDWVRMFMKRHDLSQQIAANVKNSRTFLTKEITSKYFEMLSEFIESIPPDRIYSYDEMNIIFEPDCETTIARRKYRDEIERKQDTSKERVSIMFAGNAAGKYCPPMVVFQGKELSPNWTEDGPTNAVYDVSNSGRFDSKNFENWFFNVFLKTSQSDGIKVLVGHNLGSYFTLAVIKATLENNIRLVTLPPNSSHVCQPLEVPVFKKFKESSYNVLNSWMTEKSSTAAFPKGNLPAFLKHFMKTLSQENLVVGFSLTGICPLDKDQILKQLPGKYKQFEK